MKRGIILLLMLVVLGTIAIAQNLNLNKNRARLYDRQGVPDWPVDPKFKHDVFTFVRIQYSSGGRGYWGRRGGGDWATDWPDADLNFSFRLQQMTSIKVNPEPVVLQITDPELFNYPFIYMIEPGNLYFSEDEVETLRRYLFTGGFLMVDDFWGEEEWLNFYRQIKRVFPDREPEELQIDHPIFNCVFKLNEKPQIPAIGFVQRARATGETWERRDAQVPHYKGISDDKGRMMVVICHNTDLGDGWEREGEDEYYFKEFSEKKAYPLGINIIFYAMTR